MTSRRPRFIQSYIAQQRAWITRCGGNLSGYITTYGSASDPNHSGDGGEAIYAADMARLQELLALARPLKKENVK